MNGSDSLVLGADVGGTNTKVALARCEAGRLVLVGSGVYPSRNYASLDLVIEAFLRGLEPAQWSERIDAACFAVAGPVERGRARLTNLPWEPEETTLGHRFGFRSVRIINDFAAAALGIEQLSGDDLLMLQAGGKVEHAPRVVVGAGTGLGVAILDWDEHQWEVHASEAGHTDFAPIDALQDQLLSHLRERFGRVSYERVLSGAGLARILQFLAASGTGVPTQALSAAMLQSDPAKAVTEFALSRSDALAVRALDLFVSAYGAFAGNMALASLAYGGVYVAGGIAPKIADKLQDGTFMGAFAAKGRFQKLLHSIPVCVVMNNKVGLLGALVEAARLPTR